MDVIGQSSAVFKIGTSVQLLEELRVEHADNEVERLIVIRNECEDRAGLLAELTEPHLVGLCDTGKRRKIELLESGHERDLDGLQGLSSTGVITLVVLKSYVLRISFLKFCDQVLAMPGKTVCRSL